MIFDLCALAVLVTLVTLAGIVWHWFGNDEWLIDRPDGWHEERRHVHPLPPVYDWNATNKGER